MRRLVVTALFLSGCTEHLIHPIEYDSEQSSADEVELLPPPAPPPIAAPEVCDLDQATRLFISSDDSNSTLWPVLARELAVDLGLSWWAWPPGMRGHEFFNYYDFEYAAAAPEEVEIEADMHAIADTEGDFLFQIGVTGEAWSPDDRPPVNLTLLLDESGSMEGKPMQMLQQSVIALAASLRSGDRVSVVTWDTDDAVRLAAHPISGPSDPALLDIVDGLEAGGGTDLHGGLVAGYALAEQTYDQASINRVVLISDGWANVGVTDAQMIADFAEDESGEGIYLAGIAVGEGGAGAFDEPLIDTVTDAGKGASLYVPSAEEAWKMLHDRFIQTMGVAARNVRIELSLPPGFEIVEFSGEEYSEDPEAVRPQHLAPNDSMVLFHHLRTCAPELVEAGSQVEVTVTFEDPRTGEAHQTNRTFTFAELLDHPHPRLAKGMAIFAVTKIFGHSPYEDEGPAAIGAAHAALALAHDLLPDDPDLAELSAIVDAIDP